MIINDSDDNDIDDYAGDDNHADDDYDNDGNGGCDDDDAGAAVDDYDDDIDKLNRTDNQFYLKLRLRDNSVYGNLSEN
jgi:hypothetical protein